MSKKHKFGKLAEYLIAFYLRLKFYRIVKRNYRNYAGEIDLIAIKSKTIIFVEVKARSDHFHLQEIITEKQKQRITRSAHFYLAAQSKFNNYNARFDLIIIMPWRWPIHIKNAWHQ